MPSVSTAADSLSRLRKLAQDVLAPEVQSLKARLDALHESQRLTREDLERVRGEVGQVRTEVGQVRSEVGGLRGEMTGLRGELGGLREDAKERDFSLRQDMQERESRLRSEMVEREARTLKAIETAAREIMLMIKLADSERQVAELSKRLELGSGQSAPPNQ